MLEHDSRVHVRRERDAAARRRLGLPAARVARTSPIQGSRSRRWSEAEIRATVKPMRPNEYKILRAKDPDALPSYNTVHKRCPDLFQ